MIVITGASEGLGHELAKLFKESGKKIANISLSKCPVADYNFLHNLTIGDEIKNAATDVLQIDEPLEILINCAGVWTDEPLGDITESEIKRTMASNVKSTILLTSDLIKRIKKDGSDVVNVSSIAGTKGGSEAVVYAASKWAVRGFSDSLRTELENSKCRVISFCPGGFNSQLMSKYIGEDVVTERADLMSTRDVALCLKQLLDLPKNMEVSEIFINKKVAT